MSENWTTWVWIASRSRGGVSINDMSRMPLSDMLRVRGIGVAESVNTSTRFFNCLSRSLWATPKRCSSSTTTIRSEEHTSELQSLAYLVCRLLLEKKKKKTKG